MIIRILGRRTVLQVQGTLLSCTRGNTFSIRRIVFQIHGLLWNIRNSKIGEISFNLMIYMGRLVRLILIVRLLIGLFKFFNDRIAAIIAVLITANEDFSTLTTLFLTFKY